MMWMGTFVGADEAQGLDSGVSRCLGASGDVHEIAPNRIFVWTLLEIRSLTLTALLFPHSNRTEQRILVVY